MIDAKAAVVIASAFAGAIALWAVVYGWGKWLSRPQNAARLDGPGQDARLDRIERAVEAIAIEVERLGEGQRYATRLLADRERVQPTIAPPPSTSARAITPH